MATTIGIVVVVVVVVLLLVGLAVLMQRRARRRKELQEAYGPEYNRAVEEKGSRRAAERELEQRQQQRSQLQIRPLEPASRQRYEQSWNGVQGQFVDDPQGAVGDADELVTSVMRERGYPTEGFDEQARLLSVDHANTLDNYRSGHEIAGLARRREATTEQLRQGMMHYRSLFQELVQDGGSPSQQQGTPNGGGAAAAYAGNHSQGAGPQGQHSSLQESTDVYQETSAMNEPTSDYRQQTPQQGYQQQGQPQQGYQQQGQPQQGYQQIQGQPTSPPPSAPPASAYPAGHGEQGQPYPDDRTGAYDADPTRPVPRPTGHEGRE